MNDKYKVSSEEAAHDRRTGISDDKAEALDRLHQERIFEAVDMAMGGDRPDLVLEVIGNEELLEHHVMELAAIDCGKDFSKLTLNEVTQLAKAAYDINSAIALKLRDYVKVD